jgi:hypothetical protein
MIKFDIETSKKKWLPIIENTLLNRGVEYSKTLIGDIAVYMEWCSVNKKDNDPDDFLLQKLRDIYDLIKSTNLRIKVVGEWYNPITGAIDIELEGGEFIQKNKMTSKLTGDIYLKIFTHEFLTFYKPDVIRDWKLNTILNG